MIICIYIIYIIFNLISAARFKINHNKIRSIKILLVLLLYSIILNIEIIDWIFIYGFLNGFWNKQIIL
jgi:hypothetical protein